MRISFVLNGKPYTIDVPPDRTLLDLLREDLRLTGSKKGCGHGECGSCLVYMDENLINACLVPAFRVHGSEIMTIEGYAQTKEFQAIEAAFAKVNYRPCGFCASGLVMALSDLLSHNFEPKEADIREAISGNVCRCTGTSGFIDAVTEAAKILSRKRK
jgi:carbon-monoxide dehydrogenase small subunit